MGDKEINSPEDIEEYFRERRENTPKHKKVYYSVRRKVTKVHDLFKYDIPQGTRSLIKWAPVIWKDKDWDYTYIYHILAFKFNEMSKLHDKYGITVNSKKYAEQLKYASEFAQKLADDEWIYTEDFVEKRTEFWQYVNEHIDGWWD